MVYGQRGPGRFRVVRDAHEAARDCTYIHASPTPRKLLTCFNVLLKQKDVDLLLVDSGDLHDGE